MNDRPERYRWGWITSSATLGVALLALAHVAALVWAWPDVTTSAIGSVGAAFLLAFALFVFERQFTRSVVEQVRDAAEAAVTARTEEFGNRLEDLEQRLITKRAEREATQDDAVAAISDDVSFDTISTALAEAQHVGAIRDGRLTVPGSQSPPWIAVEFQYASSAVMRGDGLIYDDGVRPRLTIEVAVPKRPSEWGTPVIQAEWSPGASSYDIGNELDTTLRRRDRLREAKVFDFPLALRNLQQGLRLALDNQRLPLGEELLHGALYEVVTEDWLVTSAGVENRRTGALLSWTKLGLVRQNRSQATPRPAGPPPGADQVIWDYVLSRAGKQPEPNIFG